MTIIQITSKFFKKKLNFLSSFRLNKLQALNLNPIILASFLIFFSILFFVITNLLNQKHQENKDHLTEITKTNEFSNLTKYLFSKINSPYEEVNYIIKNNDTVEKILDKYSIQSKDINLISTELKRKKLSNIYSGRKLSLIYKKQKNGQNTVVNLVYPLTNTSSIEIRKNQGNFTIKENILRLYKREVVVKNIIKNNLYSSAVESGVEPNIIVEFARILGLKWISKEILEKVTGLRSYMKNLKMIIIK